MSEALALLQRCQEMGVTVIPIPGGQLKVRPFKVLPEELKEALRRHKAEILSLVSSRQANPWPCPHCGEPAVIEDVCSSLDGLRTLTLWHCSPCQTWGVTPNTLREPPVWVQKTVQ